jgi:RNA polymerase sigma-70 factor (ECF subfamily)
LKVLENEISETKKDERLLIEAARRDPACFAELYENNFDRVYAFVSHRVSGRDEAEDLTAEVFHQALAGIARFEWRGLPFVAWLLGIAANVLADRRQRVARQPEATEEAEEIAGKDDKIEQRAMMAQLVEGLPQDQRLVIIRRFVEQKSLREIAQELERSEGAIKQLQLRALENLRSQMRSHHE